MLPPMSDSGHLDLARLRARAVERFRTGDGTRPDVLLLEIDGRRLVLKDYGRSDAVFGRLLGPLFTWREARALRRLEPVAGIPRLIRRVGRRALLLEYIEGHTLKSLPRERVSPALFERVEALIGQMHARGVAHCDLRSGGNTIIDARGRPHFVDFVGHCPRGARWNLLWRWAFGRLRQADRVAVARMKKRLAPELLTEADRRALHWDRHAPLARFARFVGGGIRDLTRRLLIRRNG